MSTFSMFFEDSGCPDKKDYQKELGILSQKAKGFYFISCSKRPKVIESQKKLVVDPKYFTQLADVENLPNLIMGICMSEVGRLDYTMGYMEK